MKEYFFGLVVAVKLDNQYIQEYINHYLSLGTDKIILIDNNDLDGQDPRPLLTEFGDKVIYIDKRGIYDTKRQFKFYTEAYNTYKDSFEWLAFFDSDEYFFLNKHKTVKEYLSMPMFKDVDCVCPNWKMYTDNEHIYNEDKPVLERFTTPCTEPVMAGYSFCHNRHIKTIIHCTGKDLYFDHPHYCKSVNGQPLNVVNSAGQKIIYAYPFCDRTFEYAELRHIQTKSTEEFCIRRVGLERQNSHQRFDGSYSNKIDEVNYYFKLNRPTQEKVNFINEYIRRNML